MKSFAKFIQENIKKNDEDNFVVPDDPIHYRMETPNDDLNDDSDDDDNFVVPDQPIHFKMGQQNPMKNESVIYEEKFPSIRNWANEETHDNKHLGPTVKFAEKELLKKKIKLSKSESEAVGNYSDSSSDTNRALADLHNARKSGSKLEISDAKRAFQNNSHPYTNHDNIENLDSALNHPIGHEVHVFTGLHFHPTKLAKEQLGNNSVDSTGHIGVHLPAYTSTSLSRAVSHFFSKPIAKGLTHTKYFHSERSHQDDHHILHLHLKPTDKGRAVGDESEFKSEHEVILPRNTRIKIYHKPEIYRHPNGGRTFIWHGHIHSQETPPSTTYEDGDF